MEDKRYRTLQKVFGKEKTVNRKCYAKKKDEVYSNLSLRKITQDVESISSVKK